MNPPDCERLRSELAVMARSRHVTPDDIAQRVTDHERWHSCDDPWTVPRNLPRDPAQEVP